MNSSGFVKPLEGLIVLDFSQFLSGPSAGLRLADLGARVIKVENPNGGDICRSLYISNLELDGDSTLFHSINRNKESFAADLKNPEHFDFVKRLIAKADVLIQNFRPGVMARLGLDYDSVRALNTKLIYGEISGYGTKGPWVGKPGQDLLVQSMSGLAWLNGDEGQPPMPFGLAAADMTAGAHLTQGLLAGLVQRGITGQGCRVEVSLLESLLDFQFEVLTTYLNDGRQKPKRSAIHNAHAYLGAPYGIYETADGFLALAMGSIAKLGVHLECPPLLAFTDPKTWSTRRDEIKTILKGHLKTRKTEDWLSLLEPVDYWCSDVLSWDRLLRHDGFKTLHMIQEVHRKNGPSMRTTRCPIRIDGELFFSSKGSPKVGEDNETILAEVNAR